MNGTKTLFFALAAVVATLPGVAGLLRVLRPPLGIGPEAVAWTQILSALAVMLVWINRETIRRQPREVTNRRIVLWSGIGLGMCLLYLLERRYLNVELPGREPVTFPLILTDRLASAIADAGGRAAAILGYGAGQLNEWAANSPFWLFMSDALLLLTYQAVFTCLAVAFSIGAVTLTTD